MRKWHLIVSAGVVAFGVVACGSAQTPTPSAPASAPPPVTAAQPEQFKQEWIEAGVYRVGADLTAGRYMTPGPDKSATVPMCYWARLKDDSGSADAIIANHLSQGRDTVTVNDGEFVEFTGGCGWRKLP